MRERIGTTPVIGPRQHTCDGFLIKNSIQVDNFVKGAIQTTFATGTIVANDVNKQSIIKYADFLDRNLDFHLRLAALSRNDKLVVALRDLLGGMQRFFFLGLDLGDFAAEMRSEHEELVALLQRDTPDDAVTCVRRQIQSSRDRILRAAIDDRIDLPLE